MRTDDAPGIERVTDSGVLELRVEFGAARDGYRLAEGGVSCLAPGCWRAGPKQTGCIHGCFTGLQDSGARSR